MTISGIQSHVKRVIRPEGGFFDGHPLNFVDLERIDFFYLETGSGPDFQRYGVSLKWMDEGFTDGRSANPTRAMTMVRLTVGGADDYDLRNYVDFPILDGYAIDAPDDGQVQFTIFNNDPDNLGRRWASDLGTLGNDFFRVNSGRVADDIETRLTAGENVPSAEYGIPHGGEESVFVDYLAFFVTRIEGQMIGNLMPRTDLAKNLDRGTGF